MNEMITSQETCQTRHTQNPTEYRRCMAMHMHEEFRRNSTRVDVMTVECKLREILMNSFVDAKSAPLQHSLDELVFLMIEQVEDEAVKRVRLRMLNEAFQNVRKELIG